jgi:hypothetical protein
VGKERGERRDEMKRGKRSEEKGRGERREELREEKDK